jgi:DNA-binding transcriptional ArsR family regulator
MEPSELLAGLFDKKKMAIIKYLLDHPEQEYGVRELAKVTRVSVASTHRILQTLLKLEVIDERKIKQLRLYRVSQNKATKFLDELLAVKKSAIEEFVEQGKRLTGVQEIILHGKATKEKANLLVIGQDVDATELARIVGTIKEQLRFTILHLLLAPDQYAQMASMGLYAGEKRSLFRRDG